MLPISIIYLTRPFHSHLTKDKLSNYYTNCNNTNNFEIIAKIDDDDNSGTEKEFDPYISRFNNIKIIKVNGKKRKEGLLEYVENLIQYSTGQILWTLSDCFEIIVPNWDQMIINTLGHKMNYAYSVGICGPNCGNEAPMITKKWYEATGTFAKHIAIDSYINFVGSSLNKKGYQRGIRIPKHLIKKTKTQVNPIFPLEHNLPNETNCDFFDPRVVQNIENDANLIIKNIQEYG